MAFISLGALALFAVSTAANLLLRARIKRPRAPDQERPKAREGEPIPIVYGVQAIAPNVVWWGHGQQATDSDKGFTYYWADAVMDACLGEVTAIKDIQLGGKSLAYEPVSKNQATDAPASYVISPALRTAEGGISNTDGEPLEFDIHALLMFGGRLQEGGIEGVMRWYWGTKDQPADPLTTEYYQSLGLSHGSGKPGVCYAVFHQSPQALINGQPRPFYWGTVPVPKDLLFLVQHIPNALGLGAIGEDANPAEIIYDLLTHDLRGLGLDPDLIDTDSFIYAGNILAGLGNGEGTFADNPSIGLSCTFSSQDEVEDMIEEICKHIDGVCDPDPITGLYTLKLLRGDYTFADLPMVTAVHRGAQFANARSIRMERPHWDETSNDLTLTYRRFDVGPGDPVTGEVLTNNLQFVLGIYRTRGRNIIDVHVFADGEELEEGTDYLLNASQGLVFFNNTENTAPGQTITINYTPNPRGSGYFESVASAQNLASIDQSGIRPLTIDYPFFTNELTAGWAVARLLRQLSRSLAPIKWTMNREGFAHTKGSVVRLVHDFGDGLSVDMAVRVLGVDYGLLEQGEIECTGIEDVYGVDVVPVLPAPPPVEGGALTPAPVIAIGPVTPGAIRVGLFPGDTAFNIEIRRANDSSGTGEVTLSATIPATTTFYDDAQSIGVTKYYRARLVPTAQQAGYTNGPLTEWVAMTATAGLPGVPVCTLPNWLDATTETGEQATLTLENLTDPQHRILRVEFATKVGVQAESDWVEDVTEPYSVTVNTPTGQHSAIRRRVTYVACGGDEVTTEAVFTFPRALNSLGEEGDLIYEDGEPVVEYV